MSTHVPASLLCSELQSTAVSHKRGCADQLVHACWVAAWLCYTRPAVTRSPVSVPYLATLRFLPTPSLHLHLPPSSTCTRIPYISCPCRFSHGALLLWPQTDALCTLNYKSCSCTPTTPHLVRKDLSSPPGTNCLSNIQPGLPPLALHLVSRALCSHLLPL